MKLRVNGTSGVQVTDSKGNILYSEVMNDFLRDLGTPFTFSIMFGVAAFEYDDFDGSSPPVLTYFGADLQPFPFPNAGAWVKGDQVLKAIAQLIAARDARNMKGTVGAASIAALASELKQA